MKNRPHSHASCIICKDARFRPGIPCNKFGYNQPAGDRFDLGHTSQLFGAIKISSRFFRGGGIIFLANRILPNLGGRTAGSPKKTKEQKSIKIRIPPVV